MDIWQFLCSKRKQRPLLSLELIWETEKGTFVNFQHFAAPFSKARYKGLEAVCCKSGKLFNSADFGTVVLIELKMEIVFYRPRG